MPSEDIVLKPSNKNKTGFQPVSRPVKLVHNCGGQVLAGKNRALRRKRFQKKPLGGLMAVSWVKQAWEK